MLWLLLPEFKFGKMKTIKILTVPALLILLMILAAEMRPISHCAIFESCGLFGLAFQGEIYSIILVVLSLFLFLYVAYMVVMAWLNNSGR